jgi:hypothetical protein
MSRILIPASYHHVGRANLRVADESVRATMLLAEATRRLSYIQKASRLPAMLLFGSLPVVIRPFVALPVASRLRCER